MATTFTYTGFTYDGEATTTWYAKWLLEGETLTLLRDNNRVLSGVKDKVQLPSMGIGSSIKAGGCGFTDTGSVTITTKAVQVLPLAVQKQICKNELEPLWLSAQLTQGSSGDWAPRAVSDMFLSLQTLVIQEELEEMIWQGDTSGATGTHLDEMDGLLVQFTADANVPKVAGPVALTVANITAKLDALIALIPKAMKKRKSRETVFIWIGITTEEIYRSYIANSFGDPTKDVMMIYNGYKLKVVPGIPDDTMVFADLLNLWWATDLDGEEEDLKIIDMQPLGQGRNVRFDAQFKAGIAYAESTEIVLYQA